MILLIAKSIDLNAFGRNIEENAVHKELNYLETKVKSCDLSLKAEWTMVVILFSCLEMDNLEAKLKSFDLNLEAECEMVLIFFSCLEMDNSITKLNGCFHPRFVFDLEATPNLKLRMDRRYLNWIELNVCLRFETRGLTWNCLAQKEYRMSLYYLGQVFR